MQKESLNLLPAEVAQIAENVSVEKRNEVQSVLNHVFDGVSKMREQLESVSVEDENDKVNMKLANTIRLGVRQVRLEAEKTFDAKRQEVQQQMLSYKTEDQLWLKAKQTMQILTKEIEEQARWKEETKQRIEAERFELEMQSRLNKVQKFNPEISLHDIRQFNDEMFNVFLSGLEKEYNDKIAAEKKAEEERMAKEKAEAEERLRIEAENKRLKAEAEAKAKELQLEREKAEAERKALAEKARKEQEAAEAKLKAEREAKEKLEAEIRAKEAKELAAKQEAERIAAEEAKAAAKAAKAPRKQKLNTWIDSLSIHAPQDMENDQVVIDVAAKFAAFKKWAKSTVEAI